MQSAIPLAAAVVVGLSAPAGARDVIDRCAQDGLGLPHCPMGELQAGLDKLSAGDFRQFRGLGMEGFAMLTAMRGLGEAAKASLAGDDCRAANQVYAAGEIWFEWVRLPKGATEDDHAAFDRYDRLLTQFAGAYDGPC